MGRIIATEFVSLDGVVEAPGGGEDSEYGGWSFEIDRGEEGNKFKLDETLESEALLLGRKTYEGFAGAWPSRKGEFADKFNRMPKYVVSSTLGTPAWSNTTVLRGHLVQEVGRLHEQRGGPIVVHGSPTLVQALLEHDLLDELRLMVYRWSSGRGNASSEAPRRRSVCACGRPKQWEMASRFSSTTPCTRRDKGVSGHVRAEPTQSARRYPTLPCTSTLLRPNGAWRV